MFIVAVNVLEYSILQKLSFNCLGSLLGVHRTTAVRKATVLIMHNPYHYSII